jgi:hypothetical protein
MRTDDEILKEREEYLRKAEASYAPRRATAKSTEFLTAAWEALTDVARAEFLDKHCSQFGQSTKVAKDAKGSAPRKKCQNPIVQNVVELAG